MTHNFTTHWNSNSSYSSNRSSRTSRTNNDSSTARSSVEGSRSTPRTTTKGWRTKGKSSEEKRTVFSSFLRGTSEQWPNTSSTSTLHDEHRANKNFMADLAAKMAAGPPKKPVGLVKKPAIGYEDMKEEVKKDTAQASNDAQKKLGELMKRNPLTSIGAGKQEEKKEQMKLKD